MSWLLQSTPCVRRTTVAHQPQVLTFSSLRGKSASGCLPVWCRAAGTGDCSLSTVVHKTKESGGMKQQWLWTWKPKLEYNCSLRPREAAGSGDNSACFHESCWRWLAYSLNWSWTTVLLSSNDKTTLRFRTGAEKPLLVTQLSNTNHFWVKLLSWL